MLQKESGLDLSLNLVLNLGFKAEMIAMPSIDNIKSISYLKSHAAQISDDLEMNGNPFIITQNGEASMVIEHIKQYQEKESLIAALKIIALGEKDRLQGKGISVAESRAQLASARRNRKEWPSSFFLMRRKTCCHFKNTC